jgi:hypothetical protein
MANIKITELPALATLVDTTVFSTVSAGVNYKLTGTVLKTYARTGGIFKAGAGGTGTTGYSFDGDGGFDTGMFSSGDGYLQFYSNNVKVIEVNPTGSITSFLQPIVVKEVRDTVYAATFASTFTPDCANGALQNVTLTGSITINAFSNPQTGQTVTLILTQGGSGSYTLTSTMKFAGGLKTLSTAVGSVDLLTITYTGSVYYASLVTGFV